MEITKEYLEETTDFIIVDELDENAPMQDERDFLPEGVTDLFDEELSKLSCYGLARAKFLMENKYDQYVEYYFSGEWYSYLKKFDQYCIELEERMVEHYKKAWGVTEQRKHDNQMEWVGMVNNIKGIVNGFIMREEVLV